VDDVVNHTVQRVLDLFDIHLDVAERWTGMRAAPVARLTRGSGRR
jgi:3-polyprenyl-4-hydroxybenzoate decarboxylase